MSDETIDLLKQIVHESRARDERLTERLDTIDHNQRAVMIAVGCLSDDFRRQESHVSEQFDSVSRRFAKVENEADEVREVAGVAYT